MSDYTDGSQDMPLFDLPPAAARRAPEPGRKAPMAAHAQCPGHHGERRTGLLTVGVHLVWRTHTYRTWSGVAVQCRTSGVALCATPDRPADMTVHLMRRHLATEDNGIRPCKCPHER